MIAVAKVRFLRANCRAKSLEGDSYMDIWWQRVHNVEIIWKAICGNLDMSLRSHTRTNAQ